MPLLVSIGRSLGRLVGEQLKAVQLVVEILQPGPLKGRAGQWENERRNDASQSVDAAVAAWLAHDAMRQGAKPDVKRTVNSEDKK